MRFDFWELKGLPDLLLNYPWAADLVEWLQVAKEWLHRYESFIVVASLWWIWRKIRLENDRLEERVNTLSQHVKAAAGASNDAAVKAQLIATLLDKFESAIISAMQQLPRSGSTASSGNPTALRIEDASKAAEGDYANWQSISDIWGVLKERIELKIQNISNRRFREKYSHMDRRTYREIINRLEKDQIIRSRGVVDTLRDLDRRYQKFRFNPTNITVGEVSRFAEGRQIINASRELPNVIEEPEDSEVVSPLRPSVGEPLEEAARQPAA